MQTANADSQCTQCIHNISSEERESKCTCNGPVPIILSISVMEKEVEIDIEHEEVPFLDPHRVSVAGQIGLQLIVIMTNNKYTFPSTQCRCNMDTIWMQYGCNLTVKSPSSHQWSPDRSTIQRVCRSSVSS